MDPVAHGLTTVGRSALVKSNPVGRLKDVMGQLMQYPKPSANISRAWSEVFGCDLQDTRSLMEGIIRVAKLNDEARSATTQYVEDCPDFYLAPFRQVDQLCSNMQMQTPMSTVPGFPNEGMMIALSFVEHKLDAHYRDAPPAQSAQIDDLIQSFDALLKECLTATMNEALRTVLVRQLHSIRTALMTFKITGPDGLEAAINQAYGYLFRNEDLIKKQGAGDEKVVRFFDILGRANDLASSYQLIAPALGSISKHFLLS
jgi:hypothetical protein